MSAPKHCPLSPEDMRAAPLMMAAPLDYVPEIDRKARTILTALLQDIEEHRDAWHDPAVCEESWLSAIFIGETLTALLNRTEDNHRPPDWMT